MTAAEFNDKYNEYLEKGNYGLDIENEEIIHFLDGIFKDLVKIRGFQYHQIKMKFGFCRFYSTLNTGLSQLIEQKINSIAKQYE